MKRIIHKDQCRVRKPGWIGQSQTPTRLVAGEALKPVGSRILLRFGKPFCRPVGRPVPADFPFLYEAVHGLHNLTGWP
ncbi:hypothetical protein D3C75_1345800 [compost metagenome]